MAKSKSKGIGKRRVGGGKTKGKANKQGARAGFETRHIDQVWEDVRKQVNVKEKPDGTKVGPVGTSNGVEFDADLPDQGKNFCLACNRFFVSPMVLAQHERSKPHKRRVKALKGPRPHNQKDADLAGNLGKPDNGARLYANKPQEKPDMNQLMDDLGRL